MLQIKFIEKGNALHDSRLFFSIEEAVGFFRGMLWDTCFTDYVLVINGRRYEWPETPLNLLELEDHFRHCVDMDEAFYG